MTDSITIILLIVFLPRSSFSSFFPSYIQFDFIFITSYKDCRGTFFFSLLEDYSLYQSRSRSFISVGEFLKLLRRLGPRQKNNIGPSFRHAPSLEPISEWCLRPSFQRVVYLQEASPPPPPRLGRFQTSPFPKFQPLPFFWNYWDHTNLAPLVVSACLPARGRPLFIK